MENDDGVNVSDMVMRLLRTVEEQSLYITQQDERMDKQEKMIEALEKKINKKAKVE
jgi:ABC-type iron transport system FetAB ATPase subunit